MSKNENVGEHAHLAYLAFLVWAIAVVSILFDAKTEIFTEVDKKFIIYHARNIANNLQILDSDVARRAGCEPPQAAVLQVAVSPDHLVKYLPCRYYNTVPTEAERLRRAHDVMTALEQGNW
ncbi:MAG: hypothetical protein KC594_17790, partial [Nitrospira sp.]|nr:hypothetical protein [Nitrospira sp.]